MAGFEFEDTWHPKRALIVLVSCQLGLHACMYGMRVAVPLQALSLGYSELTVGLLVACFALIPALLAIAFGRFSDRAGYHRPLRIAAGMSITAGLVVALNESLPALCIGAALSGAGSGFGVIVIQRTAGRMASTPSGRLNIFSWIAVAPAIAGVVGPTLAGVVIDFAGFRAAFAVLGSLPILTVLLAELVPKEKVDRAAVESAPVRGGVLDLIRRGQLRRLLLINWIVVASWDAHGFVIPILGHDRGFSASAIGAIFAAFGAASIIVRFLIPVFSNKLSPRILMAAALSLAAAAFVVYPTLRPAWAMAFCAFAFGLALGGVHPTILATLHDLAPRDRYGEALAVRSTMTQLSMTTMPLVFGAVGVSLGAPVLLWAMGCALGAGGWQSLRLFSILDAEDRGRTAGP